MMEIERRFLVRNFPDDLASYVHSFIRQAHVSFAPKVRIRQYGDAYFLTQKGDGVLSREEREERLSRDAFEAYAAKVISPWIEKERYLVPLADGRTAELDVFSGALAGLALVEVEFPSVEAANAFIPPDWFGQEVTGDKRYTNQNLYRLCRE
ncbi:MAG: CYTH domain-containing protein [Oscillospiraceae bacterium]|jgi:CYTH domain-containing protein|nr:CYTH domain-containing protein [Oscillospiraceae bacterium]